MSAQPPKVPYVIKKQVLVSGGDLTDAQPGRSALGQAHRHFPVQHLGRTEIFAGHARERRAAVRHRARQRSDFCAGYSRTHHRRLRADFRQFYRAGRERSPFCCARARCRAVDHHRRTHGRSRSWTGFHRRRRNGVLRRLGACHRVHAADLPAVRGSSPTSP